MFPQPFSFLKTASGSGGETIFDQNVLAQNGTQPISYDPSYYFMGQNLYDSVINVSVTSISAILTAHGDISGKTYTCEIWNTDGTNLTTKIQASAGVSGSNAWSGTVVNFTFSPSVALTGGVQYAIVFTTNAAVSNINYADVVTTAGGGLSGRLYIFNSAGVMQANSGDDLKLTIYKP